MSSEIDHQEIEEVKFYGLPKGTVLWPTATFAIIFGILAKINPSWEDSLSIAFLIIFTLNLLILYFEFSRGAVMGIAGIIFGLLILYLWLQDTRDVPSIGIEAGLRGASGDFLITFGAILLIMIFLGIIVKRTFDYFVVTRNELIRKHGILGDAQRFSAQHMVFHKQINDVFESLLLGGSGTLTVIPPGKADIFIIENVPRINEVERKLSYLLSKLEVDTT